MTYFQIKNWDSIYESHETKKLKRLHWIPMPNKHDGLGFRKISKQKEAAEIFCAWVLLVQIASKCDKRGVLIREGLPLSPDDAGDMTGFPASIFEKALSFLSSIGWLEKIDISPGVAGDSPDASGNCPAVLHYRDYRNYRR